MILRQFLHNDPVSISYMCGCGGKSTVAVVDPVADVDIYLEAAKAANVNINYVIDTHVHADHLSTGRALADAAGAEYVMSERRSRSAMSRSKYSRRQATHRSISPFWSPTGHEPKNPGCY